MSFYGRYFRLCLFAIFAISNNIHAKGQFIVPVTATKVEEQIIYQPIDALGDLKAFEYVEITSSVAEKIKKIYFRSGQEVKKGDLLVQLNNSLQLAELKSAKAELQKAKLAYERAKNLQKDRAVSKATLQERIANFQKAEGLVNEVESKLDDLEIIAPFNGVLGVKNISLGALVRPGDIIVSLADIDKVKVSFKVPSIYLSDLKIGEKIFGTVEAFPNKVFEGNIYAKETLVDPITRTIELRALIPNKDHLLQPGLLMNVMIKNQERKALVIPEEALLKTGQENFVYLIIKKENKTIVQKTKVNIGLRKKGHVEILNGLKQGESIVLHGIVKLKDGVEVTVKDSKF